MVRTETNIAEAEWDRMLATFVKECRHLRLLCGWSQARLAAFLGVTRQTVLALETGKREMTRTTFLALFFLFYKNAYAKERMVACGLCEDTLLKILGVQ